MSDRKKFQPEVEGDDGWTGWIHPLDGYQISCCDCGLVHNLDFAIDALGRIVFRASRNQRSTGQLRRQMRLRGELLMKGGTK